MVSGSSGVKPITAATMITRPASRAAHVPAWVPKTRPNVTPTSRYQATIPAAQRNEVLLPMVEARSRGVSLNKPTVANATTVNAR